MVFKIGAFSCLDTLVLEEQSCLYSWLFILLLRIAIVYM